MLERLALLGLGVAVIDDHQPSRVGKRTEHEVADGLERLLSAFRSDSGDAAASVFGEDRIVEQDDAVPVASRAEDALVALDRLQRGTVAQHLRLGLRLRVQHRGRKRRVEERRAVQPRVHVEADIDVRVGGSVDRGDASPPFLLAASRDEMRHLQPPVGRLRRSDGLLHRLGGPGVAPPGVCCVDAAAACGDAAELGELGLGGSPLLCVLEACRVSPGALLEPFLQEVRHLP